LAALGAYGICVPESLGGANLDYLTLGLVLEEIAAGDGGVSTTISVTNCPVNAILMRYGNDAQQKKWLTRLAQGELLGLFCLTEPHVGSDASAIRTTATRKGDAYVLNGVKQFITNQTTEISALFLGLGLLLVLAACIASFSRNGRIV
jgi:alkylation response protein AidB-like acyl-CoA dehydrogenase